MKASDPNAREALIARFGDGILKDSTERIAGPKLAELLDGMLFGHILEIGTFQGLSAAILAEHAHLVTTIDIERQPVAEEVWKFFGVRDRIMYAIAKDDVQKAEIVRYTTFDMAFVDGAHDRPNAVFDFALTRRCGHVLIHDYPYAVPAGRPLPTGFSIDDHPRDTNGDGTGFLLDAVVPAGRIVRIPPFAWWHKE